jgi:hypothetical protein
MLWLPVTASIHLNQVFFSSNVGISLFPEYTSISRSQESTYAPQGFFTIQLDANSFYNTQCRSSAETKTVFFSENI